MKVSACSLHPHQVICRSAEILLSVSRCVSPSLFLCVCPQEPPPQESPHNPLPCPLQGTVEYLFHLSLVNAQQLCHHHHGENSSRKAWHIWETPRLRIIGAKVSAAQAQGVWCVSASWCRKLLQTRMSVVYRWLQSSLGRTISQYSKHFRALSHLVFASSLEAGHLKPSRFRGHGHLPEKSAQISTQLLML